MKDFFDRKIGFGRYPEKTAGEVFSGNRPYFDQILYKNGKFRRAYAAAFQSWADEDEKRKSPGRLRTERILLAVELMGEKRVRALFGQLIEIMNEKYPHRGLPPDLDFRAAIHPEKEGLEGNEQQMNQMDVFWSRLAIPEVWMEE